MLGVELASPQSAARKPLLGDILVVLAQLLAATQFIVEEKYLAKWVHHPSRSTLPRHTTSCPLRTCLYSAGKPAAILTLLHRVC